MPVIDLSFVLVGTTIPLDHGYALFSALCRVVPGLHGDATAGIHPIRGIRTAPGVLSLSDWSRLKIRLPSEGLSPYIALAGKEIELDGHHVRVGIPQVEGLVPAPYLASRLVTFRNALTPSAFEEDVRRELERLEIAGTPDLVPSARPNWDGQPVRRVLRVKEKKVVGYALRVGGLTAQESLRLQEIGLGGRRRMGCGVFCAGEGGLGLMNTDCLWAKSQWPGEPDHPSTRLSGHLADVLEAATRVLDATGDEQLRALGLDAQQYRLRLRRCVRLAAALHDLGKANNHFQDMIRRVRDVRQNPQGLRHEWVSILILKALKDWLAPAVDRSELDFAIMEWAVAGHHPAVCHASPPKSCLDGAGTEMTLLTGFGDFRAIVNWLHDTFELSAPFPELNTVARQLVGTENAFAELAAWAKSAQRAGIEWLGAPSILGSSPQSRAA